MESLQAALDLGLGKGLAIAARLGYRVLRTAVFNMLFIFDEEDLKLAIERDVDLLAMFLIYAPKQVEIVRRFAGRVGKGFDKKVTLPNTLRWVKEECDRKKCHHYDVIVNVPKVEAVEKGNQVEKIDPVEPVYPPPGADMKSVNWFWKNCQKLMKCILYGEISPETKRWGVEHLRWRVEQEKEVKKELKDLLQEAHKKKEGNQN